MDSSGGRWDSHQDQLLREDKPRPVVAEDVPANQGVETGGGEEGAVGGERENQSEPVQTGGGKS